MVCSSMKTHKSTFVEKLNSSGVSFTTFCATMTPSGQKMQADFVSKRSFPFLNPTLDFISKGYFTDPC